jgi:hypothetical protein
VKVFVDWVSARRTRLIIVAIVTAPLLSIFAAALIALETVRRGALSGVLCGAAVIGGLVLLALLARTEPWVFAALGAVCTLTGIASGELIRRAGNLMLAFQAAVLICLVVVVLIGLTAIDARSVFEPWVKEIVALLPPETPPQDVALVEQRLPTVLLSAGVFLQVVCALLLGFWWALLAAGERRFGAEFRELKLGRVLGSIATVSIVLGLVFDAVVVQNLTLLAMFCFLLQGIAVLHAWAHVKRWHPALLAPLYLLLLMPGPNVLIVPALGMMGLVDQWFDLRTRMRSRT